MKILVAKERGYCYGVRDAINEVIQHTQAGVTINTYGPLIHNDRAIQELEKNYNIKAIESTSELQSQTLAIRAHGIAPSVLKDFENQGVRIIDTTCPFVTKTQDIAHHLVDEGYFVVILGKKEHPEIKGIAGHVEGHYLIIEKEADITHLKKQNKIGIVFQSTITIDDFAHIIPKIIEYAKEIKIMRTICGVTIRRQKEIRMLSKKVDMMVVIGGKQSSNTKKLTDIARAEGVEAIQIESAEELSNKDFRNVQVLGVITGTSTPQILIDEVLTYLQKTGESEVIFNE